MRKTSLLLTVLGAAAPASAQYPTLHYDPIDLGTLGGVQGRANQAHGIVSSNDRAAVGEAQTPSGDWHPFLWADGQMQDLGTFGGPLGNAAAFNLLGVVVGHADAPGAPGEFPRAFRWDPTNGLQDLGDLGGGRSWATGIDLYDESICGHSAVANGDIHGFYIDGMGGPMVDMGTLGGSTSFADDIEGHNIVGGSLTASNSMHGFTWNPSSGMVDLGTLGGTQSRAVGTALGYICGWSATSSGQTHAFFMKSSSSPMEDLGTFGGTISAALSVNNFKQVVGYSEASDGSFRAFYWDHLSQEMVDLNDLIPEHSGWELQAATHITEYGFISGYGLHDGVQRGFMLRPFRLSVIGSAGTTNKLEVLFCTPSEPIFFAWSLTGSGASAPGLFGGSNGFDGLSYAGRTLATDWGLAQFQLDVPSSVSGTTVYFKAVAPNRRLTSPVYAKTYF